MYRWFLFRGDNLLVHRTGNRYGIPESINSPVISYRAFEVVFNSKEKAYAATVQNDVCIPDSYEWVALRASYDYLSRTDYKYAGKAYQLVYWDRHSKFCPACGAPLSFASTISKRCSRCKEEYYPVITPAIIVLIRKGNQVLLVHARTFRGSFHGLVAGYVEVGEDLEACIRREVREETGLEITHITYFGSQPWPYPSGLMIGFMADYVSGEIHLQESELTAGRFFDRENLPELPQKLSIARRMIDWWLSGEQGDKPLF